MLGYLDMLKMRPLHKRDEAGRVLYGVELSDPESTTQNVWQLWKSVRDYRQFEERLCSFAFDLDQRFAAKVQNLPDQEVFHSILAFFNETKMRPDIAKHLLFRDFYELRHPDFEYLDEYAKGVIGQKDSLIIDFSWDPTSMTLFAAHKTSSKVSQITSFLKELMSSPGTQGSISINKFENGKCIKLKQIIPQAQPLRVSWSSRSSMLHVGTSIGIFVYSVSLLGGTACTCDIIQFIKIYELRDMQFVERLGITFYCSPQKAYVHSLNKESSYQITQVDLNNITSLVVEKKRERLYVSQENRILLYSFASLKNITLLAIISEVSGTFQRLLVSKSEDYLFGLSSAGFITVLETRPKGKQKLMCTYTRIDCPENSPFMAFNEKNQMFVVAKGQHVVLVDTKNIPLYAGGSHKNKITSGMYDEVNNIIITGAEDGEIILYNISMSRKYDQFLKDL